MALALDRTGADAWSARKRRAADLAQRWTFASEVMAFYERILDAGETAYAAALEEPPAANAVAAFAAERVLPQVVEIAVAHGPTRLSTSVLEIFDQADLAEVFARWLHDEHVDPIQRFIARASCGPVLEALVVSGCAPPGTPRDDDCHCPACGGLPQVSFFAASAEDLVTAHRFLACSRCATSWPFSRLTCAGCGETDTSKLVVFSEVGSGESELSGKVVKSSAAGVTPAHFPHVRIDGCRTCSRYLLTVDLERDGRAVPLVDEIAALPLDLYAKERGLSKIVPNVMGF